MIEWVLFVYMLQTLHEQMAASVHEISNLIDPVAVAARSEASQLGHKVSTGQRPYTADIPFLYFLHQNNCVYVIYLNAGKPTLDQIIYLIRL